MRPWGEEPLIRASVAGPQGATGPFGLRRSVNAPRAPADAGRVRHAAPDEAAGLLWALGMTDAVAEAPIDSELMARVAAGDHEAFATLYDRHVRAVYGAVLRYLRDPAATEEVVQETYLAMWQRPDRYAADKGSLVGWLLSIARNRAIDRLRAASRRPMFVGLDPGPSNGSESDLERLMASGRPVGSGVTADEPSDVAERRWVRSVVRTALDGMSEAERQVLELAYDDGLTQTEIAERLGWPLGTVKTRTRRAMLRLRAMLESVPDIGPWAAPSPVAAWGDPDGAQHGPH
jgi:RNA polymerase sigma-70 factor (ECF subfamily)